MTGTPATVFCASSDAAERLRHDEWDALVVESLREGLDADFDPSEETQEILSDPVWMEGLAEAEQNIQAGDVVAISEVWNSE